MKKLLANKVNNNQKNKTIIFVENSLFVSGICTILEHHQMSVKKEELDHLYLLDQNDTISICHVKNEEMEKRAQNIKLRDNATNIIIIKNNLEYKEIVRLLHIGVNGICLTDIDEHYLIQVVTQVRNGHFFLDHRLTHDVIQENIRLIEKTNQGVPLDENSLKKMLTKREIEILKLLGKGYSNIQIGSELFISNKTVKNHVSNIIHKMQVQDRLNAVIKAVQNNWIRIC
ncbi:response regulator transcription factor [Gottfriedia solisilvae]|uniref:response regulator transcription factor n=1 Tax=Gottfriedia solisilvae TaxID=1516104 RepID=UPI001302AE62|nr:response regulator transcription factor [Gottfriedia solisilvae]